MIKYKIYQVKDGLTRDFGFMGLHVMKSLGVEIDLSNYDMVYESESEHDIPRMLDALFMKFNEKPPEDYKGRSMSVSDIIEVHGSYYYCDSFGWENVDSVIIKPIIEIDLRYIELEAVSTMSIRDETITHIIFDGFHLTLSKDQLEYINEHANIHFSKESDYIEKIEEQKEERS